ncbi:unnamed protein product [Hymenolepis diminuta]|uniref:Uncharacterized protein n=1 Tax=Hymenolepis diminuta TaxID=6216 RepID=A0A564YDG7_HYMDI|nr:unnamed protein product [Hymenolepis diminuta]
MKTLARGYTHRPGMGKGTKLLVEVCLKYQNSARSFPREKKTNALISNEEAVG